MREGLFYCKTCQDVVSIVDQESRILCPECCGVLAISSDIEDED